MDRHQAIRSLQNAEPCRQLALKLQSEKAIHPEIAKITRKRPTTNRRGSSNSEFLCDLCTADIEDRAISRGFSGCYFGKLFNISVTGGKQSSDDSAAFGRELIAMRTGELAQKSMGTQECQLAGNGCTGAPDLALVGFGALSWIEQSAQVGVTQASQGELAAADCQE